MKKRYLVLFLVCIVFVFNSQVMVAGNVVEEDSWLTIYSDNHGVIRHTVQFDLVQGQQRVSFGPVTSGILTESVRFIPLEDNEDFGIVSQHYRYDLSSRISLFSQYVGEDVLWQFEDGDILMTRTVRLIKASSSLIVIQDEQNIIANPRGELILPYKEGLTYGPTLVWDIIGNYTGSSSARLSYITSGLGWSAYHDVILSEDETIIDIDSWVQVTNNTNRSFDEARLTLVAGDLNRAVQKDGVMLRSASLMMDSSMPESVPEFEQSKFFEYYTFDLDTPFTLESSQTKKMLLFDAKGIEASKKYIFPSSQRIGMGSSGEKDSVDVVIEFSTGKEYGLDKVLPGGIVNIYKEDSDGISHLIGSDSISHKASGETSRLNAGKAFDIKGERIMLDTWTERGQDEAGHWTMYFAEVKVVIENFTDEEVFVTTVERLPMRNHVEVTTKEEYEMRAIDAYTVEFDLMVPPQGQAEIVYVVESRN